MKLRVRTAASVLACSAVSLTMGAAAAAPVGGHWHLPADPTVRLTTMWASFRVADGKVQPGWEYGGGGSASQPLAGPIDLACTVKFDDPQTLAFQFTTSSGSITAYIAVPRGSQLRERTRPDTHRLTGDYQVLWLADVCQGDHVVKSLAYVVRGVPINDRDTGLDKAGLAKLQAALVATAR